MARAYAVGNVPPEIVWTIVRGDTASFRVYVTDDNKDPLLISAWTIDMQIKRNSTLIVELSPLQEDFDGEGEFTVFINSEQSELLETGDKFDIQLSDDTRVWTVAKGTVTIIEDVTN